MGARLSWNRYGKARVRLMKVTRRPDRHDVRELQVHVHLEGDFEATHVAGDNRQVLPTDTMKNTVYALAPRHLTGDIESFGIVLADHFLGRNPQVSSASTRLEERAWERLGAEAGRPHPHAFRQAGEERRIASVTAKRDGRSVESGIEGLVVLKTSGSGFEGFVRDPYTTLRETSDRLLKTAIRAAWSCARPPASYDACFAAVREALLRAFASHESRSVQHTLYAMGEAVLAAVPDVAEIRLALPNQHCLLVDLAPFGLGNPNEIFVPVDEPHGLIEALVRRE
jgi:urate oxidase